MDYEKILHALADYPGTGVGSYRTPAGYCALGWLAKKAGIEERDLREMGVVETFLFAEYGLQHETQVALAAHNDMLAINGLIVTPEHRARRVRQFVQGLRDGLVADVSLSDALEQAFQEGETEAIDQPIGTGAP